MKKAEITARIDEIKRQMWIESMADFMNWTLYRKLEAELRKLERELRKLERELPNAED